jgi:hypothetical protein
LPYFDSKWIRRASQRKDTAWTKIRINVGQRPFSYRHAS